MSRLKLRGVFKIPTGLEVLKTVVGSVAAISLFGACSAEKPNTAPDLPKVSPSLVSKDSPDEINLGGVAMEVVADVSQAAVEKSIEIDTRAILIQQARESGYGGIIETLLQKEEGGVKMTNTQIDILNSVRSRLLSEEYKAITDPNEKSNIIQSIMRAHFLEFSKEGSTKEHQNLIDTILASIKIMPENKDGRVSPDLKSYSLTLKVGADTKEFMKSLVSYFGNQNVGYMPNIAVDGNVVYVF